MKSHRRIMAERAEELRKNMTKEERMLWFSFLKAYPISFRCQKVMGNYIVDFYCRKVRLSVELDGSQHYEKKGKEYDLVRTTFLETLEVKELRFANSDIWTNFEGVCTAIHNEVQRRRNDIVVLPLALLKK